MISDIIKNKSAYSCIKVICFHCKIKFRHSSYVWSWLYCVHIKVFSFIPLLSSFNLSLNLQKQYFLQLSQTYKIDENTNELFLHFMFGSSLKCKQHTDLSHTLSFLCGHSSTVSLPLILWHYSHYGILYGFNRNSTHAAYFIIA